MYIITISNGRPSIRPRDEYDALCMLLDGLLFQPYDKRMIEYVKSNLNEINYHTGGKLELVGFENGNMIFSNDGQRLIIDGVATRKVLIEKKRK